MDIEDERRRLARVGAAEQFAWGELEEALAAAADAFRVGRPPSEIDRLVTAADAARARWIEVLRAKEALTGETLREIRRKVPISQAGG
jgi:hypothetical protein